MGTRDRDEQARQEQERQQQERQQQERMNQPRGLLNDGDDETSTNPVIVNH
jgi:hypothetical protein